MIVRLAGHAMGTRFELVLAGAEERHLQTVGEAALGEIALWDERLSAFRSDSLVSFINRTAHERPVRLDAETLGLFRTAREVWRASGGAFDITLGGLMKKWGFRGDDSTQHSDSTQHTAHSTHSEESRSGMDALVLDEAAGTLAFARPGIALDLGAIGKGHALDAAAGVLREGGVTTALLHGGTSSVVGIGAPPPVDDQPEGWRVALGASGSGAPLSPVVRLRDMSLSVSGQHGRMIERDGERLGHVLDPRTGAPAKRAGIAAVVSESARLADAWSTALLVLGVRSEGMPREIVSVVQEGEAWRIEGERAEAVVEG